MTQFLIVDDHPVVAHGLGRFLLERKTVGHVEIASSAHRAIELSHQKPFDAISLDVSLPDGDGLELLKQLKTNVPNRPVMMLTLLRDPSIALRAIRAGAAAFVTKDEPLQHLCDAVTKILAGGRYIPEWVADALAGHLSHDPGEALHAKLSDREFEVMLRIASGARVSEIADQLGLSQKTVATYRARLFEKLRMRSVAEVTAYVIHNQLRS